MICNVNDQMLSIPLIELCAISVKIQFFWFSSPDRGRRTVSCLSFLLILALSKQRFTTASLPLNRHLQLSLQTTHVLVHFFECFFKVLQRHKQRKHFEDVN